MTAVATRFPGIAVTYDGLVKLRCGSVTPGFVGLGGYRRVNVAQSARSVHRLVAETLCFNPCPELFDVVHHKNSDIFDNRPSNLQWVTSQLNKSIRKTAKGCYYNKRKKKWYARCCFMGQRYPLGWFSTFEEGHAAYVSFRDDMFRQIRNRYIRNRKRERYSSFM